MYYNKYIKYKKKYLLLKKKLELLDNNLIGGRAKKIGRCAKKYPNIICYFHICQKGNWQKSFDLLMSYIKKYKLYNYTKEIRVGIVNDNIVNEELKLIDDIRFNDDKIKILFIKPSSEYERPTLLHMKEACYKDSENTLYYYLHTKGIRHFNTEKENIALNWIKQML